MQILAALFLDDLDVKPTYEGGPTHLDFKNVHFSAPAPGPVPVQVTPHLVVLVHCPEGEDGQDILEVRYLRGGEQIARNVQPLQVESGKFNFRLVRGELDFDDYSTIEAHCRLGQGPVTVVPYTLLPPRDLR